MSPKKELQGKVINSLAILLGEVLLSIVERLDQSISDTVSNAEITMLVIEVEAVLGEGVLNVVHNGGLDGFDVDGGVGAHKLPELLVFL